MFIYKSMTNNLFGLIIALLSALLLGGANAWDPAKDQSQCKHSKSICITSFKWCSSNQDSSKGCYFPEGTYPRYGDRDVGVNPALVFWKTTYKFSWTKADASYPVTVAWQFGDTKNETYTWRQNFTKGETTFDFTFEQLAKGIPASYNMSIYEVKGRAANMMNIFRVSQPESPYTPDDYSSQFLVVDSAVNDFIETQQWKSKQKVTKKWRLGVGVGVGIGATAIAALAFFAGACLGGKKARGSQDSQQNSEGGQLRGVPVHNGGEQSKNFTKASTQGKQKEEPEQTGELSARRAKVRYA
ncbi:hypothetical protein B0T10DRAFT_605691 [Thelonectria olida]|uniref:Uncharacterized protein n=1 Tax=Thelonectria olida TaxID=1576542 RepID=A0A9P9AQL4_9HYPO|nr:hypothetical protein B0T10DRAFT_605691 [Thelonectria olida]